MLARSEFDPHGPLELKRVEEVFVRRAPVVELVVRGKIIGTTAEHPFYVVERGQFVPAHALVVGETLLGYDGQPSPLEALRDTGRIADVYNFRIADHHTYFVGCHEWGFSVWAHNSYSLESNSYALSKQGLRLRKDAMALRSKLNGDTKYRNIATAEVTINGRTATVKFSNTPDGLHSEQKLVAWYDAMLARGKSVTVSAVYTDRRPYPACNSLLTNTFGSDLTVFHSQGPGPFRP